MKKRLIIVSGTMGVGKTTICRELYAALENSVWLDGDWCWMMHPWRFTNENKEMVMGNVHFVLRAYLSNSSFEYVVFSWVIPNENTFAQILSGLAGLSFEPFKITITCSEQELMRRLREDKRSEEHIRDSIDRLRQYDQMDTVKIDTTHKTVTDTVETILKMVTPPGC